MKYKIKDLQGIKLAPQTAKTHHEAALKTAKRFHNHEYGIDGRKAFTIIVTDEKGVSKRFKISAKVETTYFADEV